MKYKLVFQDGVTDCGYASLAMILKYYNKKFSEYDLKKRLKIDKAGTSAYNIIQASKYFGILAEGYKLDIKDLLKQKTPFIAHTLKENLQHFIVVFNIDNVKKELVIGDPASGLVNIKYEEFLKIWTSIVILFDNNKSIKKNISKNNNFLLNMLKTKKKYIVKISILSFISTILNIILSFLISFTLWKILNNLNIKNILIYLVVIGLLKEIISYFRNKVLLIFNNKFGNQIIDSTINHILNLPHKFYQKYYSGEIISRIKDLSFITNIVSKFSLTIFIDLLFILGIFITIVFYNIYISILILIISFLFIIIVKIYSKYIKNMTYSLHLKSEEFFTKIVDTIQNINTVKNLYIEKYIINSISNLRIKMFDESLLLNKKYNTQYLFKNIVNLSFSILFLSISVYLINNNLIELRNILIINTFSTLFFDFYINILDSEQDLQEAHSAYKRLIEIYNEKEENNMGLNIKSVDKIEFKNVSYSYDGINKAISNINLSINKGDKILVTGPSGSGKSTLFKLLNKQLSSKRVYINNIEINKISPNSIRKLITYIEQSEKLFTDNVNNNLLLGNDIDKNILKITEIDKFNNKDLLFDANELSGGEKSKIIIGRSLIIKNDVIIFDETMNQVDIKTERKIINGIFKNYPQKTIILISHRTLNKDIFDKIIYFDKANIKEVIKNEKVVKKRVNRS